MRKIYFVVQGAFEKSDSIAGDAIYQFGLVKDHPGTADVRIFAERFDSKLYGGIPLEPVADIPINDPQSLTIYHYCDGWPDFEERLKGYRGELIIRWHNNTPPWFLGQYAPHLVQRTLRGYTNIIALSRNPHCRFMCNSAFTARQLEILGVPKTQTSVVYPASAYLNHEEEYGSTWTGLGTAPSILFVSRLVPNKGHKHILMTAAYLKRFGLDPAVIFPGREDVSLRKYSAELRQLAKDLSIELAIPGELDHSELRQVYRNSTLFLCLSEHEGFGIPIFEAMRSGLPTVAWSHGAMAELITGHPLCFPELSPKRFAAAVAALQEPDIATYVQRWQRENVLPRYTRDVVLNQLIAALDHTPSNMPDPLPQFADQEMEAYIAERIEAHYREVADLNIGPSIPQEIAGNYVTRHDIESYRALSDLKISLPAKIQNDIRMDQSGVIVGSNRFASPYPALPDGSYVCPLEFNHSHLIFGPYIELNTGAYKVGFELKLDEGAKSAANGELVVDVFSAQHGSFCERHFRTEDILENNLALEFFIEKDGGSMLEFRVAARNFPTGSLCFRGVLISRISPLTEILDHVLPQKPDKVAVALGVPSWGGRLDVMTAKLRGVKASDRFKEADAARDAKDWKIAAALYRDGLRAEPANYAMWVQCGHAHKESGALIEAVACYTRALQLQPDDADTHLQMGHALKLSGKLVEAITHYVCASVLAPPAGELARRELGKLGVSD